MLLTAPLPCTYPGLMWQQRARSAGIRQATIARALGRSQWFVSMGIRSGRNKAILAIIIAWEIMTPVQRIDWMLALDLPRARQPAVIYVRAAMLSLCTVSTVLSQWV